MLKRLFLVFFLASATFLAGCGDSNNFDGAYYNDIDNGGASGPLANLSGRSGTVALTTTLEGVNAQTIELVESNTVPDIVDEFRFTGFDASGNLIYASVKPKASTVTLKKVPVEVTSLRVELLAQGLVVGGLSTPIIVKDGQTTPLTNPTYVFPSLGDLASSNIVAYGSYATAEPSEDDELYFESEQNIDFPRVFSEKNVSRKQDGSYTVAEDGDYLVTYQLHGSFSIFNQSIHAVQYGSAFKFQHLNSSGTVIESLFWQDIWYGNLSDLQAIVSLKAGESVSLNAGDTWVFLEQGTFSIVRIGNNTNSKLPASTEPVIPK